MLYYWFMVVKTRALLINSDTTTSRLWIQGLEQEGMAVTNPRMITLEAIRADSFNLIIIAMPTSPLEGLALCRQLRLQTGRAVLLLVGDDDERLAVAAYQAGVDEFIINPVSPLLLAAKAMAWLRWVQPIPEFSEPSSVEPNQEMS
jgi:two-component system OmpR family response regulator